MRKVNFNGGKNSVGITISNKAGRKFIFSLCKITNFYLSNGYFGCFLA